MKFRDVLRYAGFLVLFTVADLAWAYFVSGRLSHDAAAMSAFCTIIWALREERSA